MNGDDYIGKAGTSLYVRAKEHLNGLEKATS